MKPEYEITYQFTAENLNLFGNLILTVCSFPNFIEEKFGQLQAEINRPDPDGEKIKALMVEMRVATVDTKGFADTLAQTLGQSVPVRIAGGEVQ